MAKLVLLNDGQYGSGLDGLEYPIEVESVDHRTTKSTARVLGSELIRIGGDPGTFHINTPYIFLLGTEAELV